MAPLVRPALAGPIFSTRPERTFTSTMASSPDEGSMARTRSMARASTRGGIARLDTTAPHAVTRPKMAHEPSPNPLRCDGSWRRKKGRSTCRDRSPRATRCPPPPRRNRRRSTAPSRPQRRTRHRAWRRPRASARAAMVHKRPARLPVACHRDRAGPSPSRLDPSRCLPLRPQPPPVRLLRVRPSAPFRCRLRPPRRVGDRHQQVNICRRLVRSRRRRRPRPRSGSVRPRSRRFRPHVGW